MDKFKGFSKLKLEQRHEILSELGFLNKDILELLYLKRQLDMNLAEKMIENVIGSYALPVGVAVNFVIDGKSYVIPMAIEETSVIASASKTARYIQEHGTIKTKIYQWEGTGQIQYSKIENVEYFESYIKCNADKLLSLVNEEILSAMVNRKGGAKELFLRKIKRNDGYYMAVLHLHINTCDSMGANKINQCCEYLAKVIQKNTHIPADMCILTNLSKRKLVKSTVTIDKISLKEAQKIEEASLFAQMDPYRAATSNKGVFNAIDAILLATGNDWRAVEACIHAYTCRTGHYQPISKWFVKDRKLIGELKAPIDVGIVGGVTQMNSAAQASIKILQIRSAAELARVVATAGLVQNLGALRALTGEGITQGHMRLHISNLLETMNCREDEKNFLKIKASDLLKQKGFITSEDLNNLKIDLQNKE